MAPPSPLPEYVYKILPEAPPDPLPANLPLSAADSQDGFIHLSTAAQMPATADRFYSGDKNIWVLRIPLERIKSNLKWEEVGSGCFPHLYGAGLGRTEVERMKAFTRGDGGSWAEILEKDELLS